MAPVTPSIEGCMKLAADQRGLSGGAGDAIY